MYTRVPFLDDGHDEVRNLPPGKLVRMLPDGRGADDASRNILAMIDSRMHFIPSVIVLWVDENGEETTRRDCSVRGFETLTGLWEQVKSHLQPTTREDDDGRNWC